MLLDKQLKVSTVSYSHSSAMVHVDLTAFERAPMSPTREFINNSFLICAITNHFYNNFVHKKVQLTDLIHLQKKCIIHDNIHVAAYKVKPC